MSSPGFATSTGGGPGAANVVSGGGITYRSPLDLARSVGRTPEAQYPSGYLGDVRNRYRSDQRGYARGPDAGGKLPDDAYLWPEEFAPDSALVMEAAGLRFVPSGLVAQTDVLLAERAYAGAMEPRGGYGGEIGQDKESYGGPPVGGAAMLEALRPPWHI